MITYCEHCGEHREWRHVFTYEHPQAEPEPDDPSAAHKLELNVCTTCGFPHLDRLIPTLGDFDEQDVDENGVFWWPYRLYPPEPDTEKHPHGIPGSVRSSLEEAKKCMENETFDACAVMTGRALEAICRHFGAGPSLGRGLEQLRARGIIDGRIEQWGLALHRERNNAAHPNDDRTNAEDASDLYTFAVAICLYVFALEQRFREFLIRKAPDMPTASGLQ